MLLSEKLLSKRKEAGNTQQKMADMIGVTLRQYIRWEKGEVIPNINKFKELGNFLDSPPSNSSELEELKKRIKELEADKLFLQELLRKK